MPHGCSFIVAVLWNVWRAPGSAAATVRQHADWSKRHFRLRHHASAGSKRRSRNSPAKPSQFRGTRHKKHHSSYRGRRPAWLQRGTPTPATSVETAENHVVFATHHKTGNVLMEKASHCFENSSVTVTLAHRWAGEPVPANSRIVHLVRNPFALAVSAYKYHMDVGEDWTLTFGSARQILRRSNSSANISRTISYTDFLRQSSARDGIMAEVKRLASPRGVFDQFVRGTEACEKRGQQTCMEVCLEAFMGSSASYDTMWYRILEFAGLTKKHAVSVATCLTRHDINRRDVHGNHVTSVDMDSGLRNRLYELVIQGDKEALGNRLHHLASTRYSCDLLAHGRGGYALANPLPF